MNEFPISGDMVGVNITGNYSRWAMKLLHGCHGNQCHPKNRQFTQTYIHLKLKRSQSYKWNFKLFQVHPTCSSISVVVNDNFSWNMSIWTYFAKMTHRMSQRLPGCREGSKGHVSLYRHDSRCPVPIEMELLITPSIFLFTLKGQISYLVTIVLP